jgi:hypothetical protein
MLRGTELIFSPDYTQAHHDVIRHQFVAEFVFTVIILQILVWIYEIAIHSRIFILDFPATICEIYTILCLRGYIYLTVKKRIIVIAHSGTIQCLSKQRLNLARSGLYTIFAPKLVVPVLKPYPLYGF